MPYKLGSRRLALDVAWEHNGVQYPANWLRLSTAQDRAELGILWEDASPTYNQKWYWGKDSDNNLIPKTYTDLKTLWIAKTKETANKLLQPSDWRGDQSQRAWHHDECHLEDMASNHPH